MFQYKLSLEYAAAGWLHQPGNPAVDRRAVDPDQFHWHRNVFAELGCLGPVWHIPVDHLAVFYLHR